MWRWQINVKNFPQWLPPFILFKAEMANIIHYIPPTLKGFHNSQCFQFFLQKCTQWHGLRTSNESLFSNIPNTYLSRLGRSQRYFRVFWVVLCTCSNFVTCVILVSDFALLCHVFCKKLRFSYIWQDFLFGIGIWIWAVENLRSSHHVSVAQWNVVVLFNIK